MAKKIIIVIIVILVLGGAAWVIRMYLDDTPTPQGEESVETSRSGIFSFLGIGNDTRVDTTREVVETNTRNLIIPTLRKITDEAVSGATFVGTSTIRYTLRGNGHIIETSVNSWDERKIVNTTIPEVQKAIWFNEGNSVIYQKGDSTIETRVLEIQNSSGTSTGSIKDSVQTFLEEGIEDIAVSPDTKSFAYTKNDGGETKVVIGESSFNIPSQQWNIDWPENNTLIFTTKGSALSLGYSYRSSLTGSLEKITGGLPGFTLKTFGENTLFTSDTDRFRLFLDNTGTIGQLIPGTLPEKCVNYSEEILCATPKTLPLGDYPDSWYKGVVSFDDEFVSYDPKGFGFEVLHSPTEDIDAVDLRLNQTSSHLLFINKKDLTLWALDLGRI
ncbi:MAG: hypothetical protein MRY49_02395 [Candidatus Pacebacteria bacterium]|nr:hypothetical protein [Candidatus Paceibacterota bacterium]